MTRTALWLGLLLILALANADAAEPAAPKQVPMRSLEKSEIPLEDLAHAFFFHDSGATEELRRLIGPNSLEHLTPMLAEHRAEMVDMRRIAGMMQQTCVRLQSASSASEIADIMKSAESKERQFHRAAARRALAQLDPIDRANVETYLDKSYRVGFGMSEIDYEAWFASVSFPSEATTSLTWRICDAAAKAESGGKSKAEGP